MEGGKEKMNTKKPTLAVDNTGGAKPPPKKRQVCPVHGCSFENQHSGEIRCPVLGCEHGELMFDGTAGRQQQA